MMKRPMVPSRYGCARNSSRRQPCVEWAPARLNSLSKVIVAKLLIPIPDARVDRGVKHVDGEVCDHHDHGDQHHEVLDDRLIAPAQGLDREAGDARNIEYGFAD